MHSNWRRGLLFFLAFLLGPHIYADRVSKALKKLQQGKHEKVEILISKSLEKHPVNAGAHYVLALLYFDSTYHRHHLDSAHYFIELALRQDQSTDSLDGWPLDKSRLSRKELLLQKHTIDSTAFHWASSQHTVASYQHFIDNYPHARQLKGAVSNRDQLAFIGASELHTYQSYKEFMERYPEAPQVPEAEKRYHLLLFQSMTKDGKLQDFVHFLKKNPQSPYRLRAEKQIFELQTLDHHPQSYAAFLKDYPQSSMASRARDFIYHMDKSLIMGTLWQTDSLTEVEHLGRYPLAAVYENNQYGFIDVQGNIRIPVRYDSIPDNLLCDQLIADVFPIFEEERWKLTGRNSKVVFDQPYDQFTPLGQGFLKMRQADKYGIVHKGGWKILPVEFDDINLLPTGFFAVKQGTRWGLFSTSGREIYPAELQEVTAEGSFVALRKNDRWALLNKEIMLEWYRTQSIPLDFRYDDWELTSPGFVLVSEKDKEGILNEQLQTVVPMSKHQIYEVDSANWYTKTSHGTVRFYGAQLKAIPPDRFEEFIATEAFVCLGRSSKWELWDRQHLTMVNEIHYDTVARLGNDLLLLGEGDLRSVLFPNGSMVATGPKQLLRHLRSPAQTRGFLQVSTPGGLREVYNQEGQRIYKTWYYDMQPLTASLLTIEKNGQKGVVNLAGQVLLKARYETVVADSDDHLTLLLRGRFGFYHVPSKRLISPQYESRISYFSHNLLLASKRGSKGLIDLRNRTKVPFQYQDIKPWSDSVVLVQKDRTWSLYNYITRTFVLEGATQWNSVTDDIRKSAIFRMNGGYGLIDNQQGIVLEPNHNDILNLGTDDKPLYLAEQHPPGADTYQIKYLNHHYAVIREQTLSAEEHEKFWCF